MENQTILLRQAEIEPTAKVLEETLGKELFEIYREIAEIITAEFGMKYEWRFYRDGKSWLFKAIDKKKTIFWFSIWEGFIKTSFYFTAKARPWIFDLPISGEIKENFGNIEITGKLIPLILDISSKEQLGDFKEIAKYKKMLK